MLLSCTALPVMAQSSLMQNLISTLPAGSVPSDLLSTKTIALYDPTFSNEELEQIQRGFDQTGVDAVLYCPLDLPMCNRDVQKVFTDYLIKREIKHLLFIQKKSSELEFIFTEFTKTKELIKPGQSVWKISGKSINEISLDIYRTALNNQKRVNMLVGPLPEFDLKLSFIKGMRAEYFTADLKMDKLAIIKFGDEPMDKALEEIFKTHYPFAYQFFDAGTEEPAIRQKGFLFSLSFINTRGYLALELLEYNMTKAGSAITSASYPSGQLQLQSFPADRPIFKFYFKHLENQNIYLGTRWDADPDWQQALLNQIKGLKAELRIN